MKKNNATMYALGAAAVAAVLMARKKSQTVNGVGATGSERVWGKLLSITNWRRTERGNPSAELHVLVDDDNVLYGRTAPNGMIGHKLFSNLVGKETYFYYHFTPSGKIVFTDFDY